jgi:hypothetical protein
MHIHASSININAANLDSAGNTEKAAAAQRAADVRKKLLKSAQGVEGAATPEEALMIDQWLNARPGQAQSEDEYTAGSGRVSDFG